MEIKWTLEIKFVSLEKEKTRIKVAAIHPRSLRINPSLHPKHCLQRWQAGKWQKYLQGHVICLYLLDRPQQPAVAVDHHQDW